MLTNFVAVYIPGTNGLPGTDKSELTPAEQNTYAQETARKLSARFGGSTSTTARGYYVADNGTLVEENIIIVKSFYATDPDAVTFAESVASWLKSALCQELVTVETNSGIEFI